MATLNHWLGTSITQYIPPKRLLCYLTGKLVKDTKEEQVLQKLLPILIEEYGYSKEQLERDFRIQIGTRFYPVDIAIFLQGLPHKQENIYVVIETEPEERKPTDKEHGVSQLKSYMLALPNCQFGVWTNGIEKYCFQKKVVNGRVTIVEISDIPPNGMSLEEYEKPTFSQLRPATELRSVFKRCHNYIAANQGLPKDVAFYELLKVIFCKIHDERTSSKVQFYVTEKERATDAGLLKVKERIDSLFRGVKNVHSRIFEQNEEIKLNPRVLAYVVSQLQHYSLLETDTDVKGEAYEEIVGANLRGDRGEFFTPRNVCRMTVEMLFSTYPIDQWNQLRILDPACGTGGFLITVIEFLRKSFYEQELAKWHAEEIALERANERLVEYCKTHLYGIDINPLLVKASQMNEVMHGNGSSNLFAANSLLPPPEWPDDVRRNIRLESFDIVLTNPPFGSKLRIDDPHILIQYDLGHKWKKVTDKVFEKTTELRPFAPPEELFIERCVQFLKPHGKAAIIVPNSILSNPSLEFIRYWILKNCRLLASVDLPRETFLPFVGTKTSVIFLEKKDPKEISLEEQTRKYAEYESFMAIAEKVGHDRRGKPVYRRTEEGELMLMKVKRKITRIREGKKEREIIETYEPIIDDDLPKISLAFRNYFARKVEWK